MTYATLDVNLGHHPKTAMAGPLAFGYHVAGILYCKRHATDGFIPTPALGSLLAGVSQARGKQLAEVLVGVRYWEAADGGYAIHDWLAWNDSAEDVKARREAARDRARTWRVQRTHSVRTAIENVIRAGAISESESESESEQEQDPPNPPGGSVSEKVAQRRKDALEILHFLNEKAGKHYKPVRANLRFIEGRLADGASPADCRVVIARQIRAWRGTERETYLRPETLFNATKFASYIGQVPPEEPANGVS
jgi:uncharacterized phage protein (TIGR02220 family)